MRLALAALSGILLGMAFPRPGISLLALVAFVPLLIALQNPGAGRTGVRSPGTAFRLGYVTGIVFFVILLHWIPRLPPGNVTIPFLLYPAVLLLAAYLGLYAGLAAMGAAWLGRRGVPIGFSFPALWVLLEAVRAWGVFGFPWGSVGYALAPYPHLIEFAEYVGLWGVSLWVVGMSGLVHRYLSLEWVRPKAIGLILLLVAALGPFLHGQHVLGHRQPRAGVDVGIIQPNIGDDKWKVAARDSLVEAVLAQTADLVAEAGNNPPDLIVWPETAVPVRLGRDMIYRHWVESVVDSLGVPLFAGYPDGYKREDGSYRFTNSAALILPGAGIQRQYDKRRLVPFSENFPLPILNRFDFGQSNFTAGKTPGVVKETRVPFGVLICFESIFPSVTTDLCRRGVRYLVNITNDQWFGDSAAPLQHFHMNILRCIEHRIGMVRAANTGISAIIDPYGLVTLHTPTFVPRSVLGTVELRNGPTVYTRFGDWILLVLGIYLAGSTVWTFLREREA